MTDFPDLWPDDIGDSKLRTPTDILKAQASLLGDKTNQLVKAEVHTESDGDDFRLNFYLVAPTLDNYRFELFRAFHSILLYPVTFVVARITSRAADERELLDVLANIFKDGRTRSILASLIAQARQ